MSLEGPRSKIVHCLGNLALCDEGKVFISNFLNLEETALSPDV